MIGLVVVGTSRGGLAALRLLLRSLPAELGPPIAVVQHRGFAMDDPLLELLQAATPLRVVEPVDKEEIAGGTLYVAPADYHLLVEGDHFALSTEAAVLHSRPSIDVLFETAAEALGPGVVAVVLTGANEDGANGAAVVLSRGGRVLVQDPGEAEAPEMPTAALPYASEVLPLESIAARLAALASADRAGEGGGAR